MFLAGKGMGTLTEVWASRKNRRKDWLKYMEGVGDDCRKEFIRSSGDQSQKGKAIGQDVAHADDPWKKAFYSGQVRGLGIANPGWDSTLVFKIGTTWRYPSNFVYKCMLLYNVWCYNTRNRWISFCRLSGSSGFGCWSCSRSGRWPWSTMRDRFARLRPAVMHKGSMKIQITNISTASHRRYINDERYRYMHRYIHKYIHPYIRFMHT